MFESFKRNDFAVFATFVYSYENMQILVRKDKGINTAADLKGKKLATPMGTTGQFFTELFLLHNSIPNPSEKSNL